MKSNKSLSMGLLVNICIFVLLSVAKSIGSGYDKGYILYSPAANDENYYVYTGIYLPAESFTVCLWWRLLTLPYSNKWKTLISIALEDEDDLHLVQLQHTTDDVDIWVYSDGRYIARTEFLANLTEWTYTCTMTRYNNPTPSGDTDVQIMAYHMYGHDGDWSEIQEFSKEAFSKVDVSGDATVALFQDQDHPGGGFHTDEATDGWRACLNIWNGTFNPEVLLNFADCEERGDIFSLSENVGVIGGNVTGQHVTPIIDGASDDLPISGADSAHHLCYIVAKVLPGLSLHSARAASKHSCAIMCAATEDCHAANFYSATGSCDLGSREESLLDENLITSTDAVHIRIC